NGSRKRSIERTFLVSRSKVLSSLRLFRGLGLLSSTPGITVVVGFPFTASTESPCASETNSLFLAVNGRTSTAPSRPERGSLADCRQGFYGGQPTSYPSSDLSPSQSHSPHPMVTGSYD